tara:strand:- start:1818 stop:2366 length:549 start_codon:yes stop_codon:yes gene_type:complete
MSNTLPMKIVIATQKNISDEEGNILPKGTYYFLIKKHSRGYVYGNIHASKIPLVFKTRTVLFLMSMAQSKMGKALNIDEEGMPKYEDEKNDSPKVNSTTFLPHITQNIPKCTICLEAIGDRHSTRLSCNHEFHTSCIYKWFSNQNRYSRNCPICRAPHGASLNTTYRRPTTVYTNSSEYRHR